MMKTGLLSVMILCHTKVECISQEVMGTFDDGNFGYDSTKVECISQEVMGTFDDGNFGYDFCRKH